MCINSSQYEMRVTEINDCEHGQTFTSEQIRGGSGQCADVPHKQWNSEYHGSAENRDLFSCGTAHPGDCLSLSLSLPKSLNNHA